MRHRLRRFGATIAVLVLVAGVGSSARQPSDNELAELRRQVLARFDVVALRAGIALVGRSTDRRVEVVDGLILDRGTPIPGADLRRRLGADAALVTRLSYLDNDALGRLFAPPPVPAPAAAAPPPAAPAPPPPAAAAPSDAAPPVAAPPAPPGAPRTYRRSGARLAFGKSLTVAENEEVTDGVVAIGGRIRIAGRVRDEVVAIGGDVELLPTADVRGDITAIGGRVSVAPGARHSGRIHDAEVLHWPAWSWPLAGWSWLDLDGAGRWVGLAATLTRVGVVALAVALVMALAGARITRIRAAAAATPLRAGATGLGLQLVFVPALVVISLGLAITIIGLPFVALLVPLALATMVVTMLLGFSAVAHAIGGWTARRLGWDDPPAVAVALIGVTVIVLPTILARLLGLNAGAFGGAAFVVLTAGAFVEYLAWTVGLGAAALTGLGRWATAPPPVPPPPPWDSPADAASPV
ncbi:MAG: hypothetical protein AB7U83_02355 [Vicinamibacterales bacterium]